MDRKRCEAGDEVGEVGHRGGEARRTRAGPPSAHHTLRTAAAPCRGSAQTGLLPLRGTARASLASPTLVALRAAGGGPSGSHTPPARRQALTEKHVQVITVQAPPASSRFARHV